jgi:hypothetical protein
MSVVAYDLSVFIEIHGKREGVGARERNDPSLVCNNNKKIKKIKKIHGKEVI